MERTLSRHRLTQWYFGGCSWEEVRPITVANTTPTIMMTTQMGIESRFTVKAICKQMKKKQHRFGGIKRTSRTEYSHFQFGNLGYQ